MDKSPHSLLPVHLWIYNHPFSGISDQVEFFLLIMRQAGYPTTVGQQPRMDALNVVIENFTGPTSTILIDFCKSTGKKVAIIMTEHIDFLGSRIYFYGRKLFDEGAWGKHHAEYMHPVTQQGRVRYLLESLQYIYCFFTLGDLPELRNFKYMVPGIPVRSLPFPRLPNNLCSPKSADIVPGYDVVFTGHSTLYRNRLLDTISKELTLLSSSKFVSRKVRNQFNRSGKIVLNIPQFQDWSWISTLRVFSGLLCGKATVSLGTTDKTCISACCRQLDIRKKGWMAKLIQYVNDSDAEYKRAFLQYSQMAEQYSREKPFPHEIFECWEMLTPAIGSQDWKRIDTKIKLSYRMRKPLKPPKLLQEGYFGFNLVSFSGKVFAVRQALGPIDFCTVDLESLIANKNCFVGASLDSIKGWIRSTNSLKELISSSKFPQLLQEGYFGFNLVGFNGKVFAVRQALGSIDFCTADLESLIAKENCFVGDSLDSVKELISSLKFPQLIQEGYFGFNLVGFNGKVFAIRQSLGPIDFCSVDLEGLVAKKNCFVGGSLDSLKEWIRSTHSGQVGRSGALYKFFEKNKAGGVTRKGRD